MPGARFAPAASRAKNKKHGELVTTVTPVSLGIPRANGFNGFLRALLVSRACCHHRLQDHHLTGLISASGYQDHTTSPSASRALVLSREKRPPHPLPNVL